MSNPVAQAFTQGMWQCGGKTLAKGRPNDPNEMLAAALDAVRNCAGGVFGVDSDFADLVGSAYERALRAEIAKGGQSAQRAIKIGRVLDGIATKLALLKLAELAVDTTMLFADAHVGATTITLRLEGTPPKLGAWQPSCKTAGGDSSALYKNLALQGEFNDKGRDLWQFPSWASASRKAVKPLSACTAPHRESVASDVERSWADKKAAAVVAKAIRAMDGAGSVKGRVPCMFTYSWSGESHPVDLSGTSLTCEQALRVLTKYDNLPADGDYGNFATPRPDRGASPLAPGD